MFFCGGSESIRCQRGGSQKSGDMAANGSVGIVTTSIGSAVNSNNSTGCGSGHGRRHGVVGAHSSRSRDESSAMPEDIA